MNNDFKDVTENRRSIRTYDEHVKISKKEMTEMINETMLAPSSFNMQPYRFLVIESDQEKKTIEDYVQFNKLQLNTSSAMVFVLGDYHCFDNFEKIYGGAVEAGKMPQEVFEQQAGQLKLYYQNVTKQALKERILLDSGIVIMNFMLVARNHGFDTCPMGGFEKETILDALGIDSERYFPMLMISIGKGKEAGFPPVRLAAEEVTIWK